MTKYTTVHTRHFVPLFLAVIATVGVTVCTGPAITTIDATASDPAISAESETDLDTLEIGDTVTAPAPEGWYTDSRNNSSSSTAPTPAGWYAGSRNNSNSSTRPKNNPYGTTETLVKSVSKPTAANPKNVKTTQYGTVDWSTAAQGYITFTAKGQERCFILQSPNGIQAEMDAAKDETIKVALVDGTGKYQYAIANNNADKTKYYVQYKDSFTVNTIDSDLAPYLVSTPYGDYANAPVATKKADELWDKSKGQFANIEALADYVGDLDYNKNLKQGTAGVYVNPDSVIENGGGVCNEMSKLLVAMLRSKGVPAYYEGGINHAWVRAWCETSSYTKNGKTYSTGIWLAIEATSGQILTKSAFADSPGYNTEKTHTEN